MYLVSPCAADLVVKKAECTCAAIPTNWRWDFGGGLQDVKPGTLALDTTAISGMYPDPKNQALAEKAMRDYFAQMTSPQGIYSYEGASVILPDNLKAAFRTENAVKICDQRGIIDTTATVATEAGAIVQESFGIIFSKLYGVAPDYRKASNPLTVPEYKVDCLEATMKKNKEYSDTHEYNYCTDSFTVLENARYAFLAVTVVADVVVTGATAGGATPVALFITGVASGAVDLAITKHERWPAGDK